jgi:predicted transcriptional regulator of viral defense system
MKPGPPRPKARQYIDNLAAAGRYHFLTNEAQEALGVSNAAVKVTLSRLAKRGVIASPARGFYVIVPPEYRALGCLPADQFIPALMKTLNLPYYAGLLTAAQYHGAAHQRPQQFQVLLEKRRLPIVCGKVRVAFLIRKRLREVPVQSLNTPRGTLLVSTPEATALDLVGYQHQTGGLSHVATVLSELAEKIDPAKLAVTAAAAPVPWAQRLGYLFERVGAAETATPLKQYVRARARESAPLLAQPRRPKAASSRRAQRGKVTRDEGWKLYVNTEIQPDL